MKKIDSVQTGNFVKPQLEPAVAPADRRLRDELRGCLLGLSYHAFAGGLCILLTRLGYTEVQLAGRTGWKGRNCGGGYDIEAFLSAGIERRRVIVQVKQFEALPIFQRSVDELRGTCLRAGAAEALLITTSIFSPVVRQNAEAVRAQVAPVSLLDGEALLGLLITHGVGIRKKGYLEKKGSLEKTETPASEPARSERDTAFFELDTAFFETLARTYTHKRHIAGKKQKVGAHPSSLDAAAISPVPAFRLTIQVHLPKPVTPRAKPNAPEASSEAA